MTHLQDKEKVQGPKGSDETFPFLHVSLSISVKSVLCIRVKERS